MSDDDKTRLPEDSKGSNLLTPGQQFGQYEVIRLLGRGGMGEVYEVENPILGKHFALKLVNREIMQRPEAVERFKREAMVMSGFDHPNIVKVDDFGEIEGHAVLRMELVGCEAANESGKCGVGSGEFNSLDDLLTGEPLPEKLVVDLLKQILEGLAYAHDKGVVHRDLKPSNILLDVNRRVRGEKESDFDNNLSVNLAQLSGLKKIIPKITDFGLVRLAGEEWLQSQVQLTVARSMTSSDSTGLEQNSSKAGTSTQALLGTFEFMAPEQKDGREATAQSDLYAIGLIAYRMLTGQKSLGMETASQMVEGLNPAWDAWLIKALKQKSEDRFANAATMLAEMPKPGVVPKATARSQSPNGGKGKWYALVAVLIVLLCGGSYYFGIYQPEQRRIAEDARQAEVARLQAEEKARLEAERKAEEERVAAEAALKAEEQRLAAEAARQAAAEKARLAAEAERLRIEQEKAAAAAEAARIAEEARAEAERKAEAERQARLKAQREVEEERKRLAKLEAEQKAIEELRSGTPTRFAFEEPKAAERSWSYSVSPMTLTGKKVELSGGYSVFIYATLDGKAGIAGKRGLFGLSDHIRHWNSRSNVIDELVTINGVEYEVSISGGNGVTFSFTKK